MLSFLKPHFKAVVWLYSRPYVPYPDDFETFEEFKKADEEFDIKLRQAQEASVIISIIALLVSILTILMI